MLIAILHLNRIADRSSFAGKCDVPCVASFGVIVSANASEMIAEAAMLMEFGGSAEDLARTCHAHPTLTEAVKEAALAVDKRAIHL